MSAATRAGAWRDVGPCAVLHGKLSNPIGAVATVGKNIDPGFGRDKNIQDAIEDKAVIHSWGAARLVRQLRFDRPKIYSPASGRYIQP